MTQRHRVLVVDDEEGIQQALAEWLRFEGYEVRSASHGQAALDVLAGWRPEAILLDLRMPVMDGRAFRAAQRRLGDGLDAIPVIVLSGSRDTPGQARSLEAAACLAKPFDLDEVRAVVGQTIEANATVTGQSS